MKVKLTILSLTVAGVIGAYQFNSSSDEAVNANTPQQHSSTAQKNKVNTTDGEIVYSRETDLPVVVSEGLFNDLYFNVAEMYKAADIVGEIKVKNQVVKQFDHVVDTRSTVEIVELFKGDPTITNALVVEMGGPMDVSKLKEAYKDKPGDGVTQESPDIIESTLEGVPAMKQGNDYFVFLKKTQPSVTGIPETEGLENGYYTVVGSIQGKIKLDQENGIAVATVNENLIDEEIVIFQKPLQVKKSDT